MENQEDKDNKYRNLMDCCIENSVSERNVIVSINNNPELEKGEVSAKWHNIKTKEG